MKQFKAFVRKNIVMTNIIIALLGVICIGAVLFVENEKIEDLLIGIGGSFLSSGIIVFITTLFMDNTENDINLSYWGIEAIYNTRAEMNTSCDKYSKHAKRIDVIAFGLKSWRDTKNKEIEKLLRNGCKIRILTMDPDCENLRQRERDEAVGEGGISYSIKQLVSWATKLNQKEYEGSIEIRFYDAHPLNFLFLMNNRLFTGPYEYGKGSQQTISYEFNTTGEGYRYYSEYFNDLWNDQEFAKKD